MVVDGIYDNIPGKMNPDFVTGNTIVIKLTNEGNVTDSYLGIPRSVFVTDGGAE